MDNNINNLVKNDKDQGSNVLEFRDAKSDKSTSYRIKLSVIMGDIGSSLSNRQYLSAIGSKIEEK